MYGILDSTNTNVIAEFVTPLSIISNVPVFSADTLSLKRNSQRRPSQRWEISTKLMPLSTTANDLFVMFVINGTVDSFKIRTPQNTGSVKNRSGSGTCALGASGISGDNSITIAATSNVIPKGTFIKFSDHAKVYLTTTTKSSNIVNIFPSLRQNVTNGTTFKWLDDVDMTVILDDSSIIGMSYTDGVLMDNGEIKLVEAL